MRDCPCFVCTHCTTGRCDVCRIYPPGTHPVAAARVPKVRPAPDSSSYLLHAGGGATTTNTEGDK